MWLVIFLTRQLSCLIHWGGRYAGRFMCSYRLSLRQYQPCFHYIKAQGIRYTSERLGKCGSFKHCYHCRKESRSFCCPFRLFLSDGEIILFYERSRRAKLHIILYLDIFLFLKLKAPPKPQLLFSLLSLFLSLFELNNSSTQ